MLGYIGMNNVAKNHSEMKVENIGEFDKIVYLELRLTNGKGQVIKKILRGEESRKWFDYMRGVCGYADANGVNPKWQDLKWEISKI